jgi:hypothetical protein
MGDCFDSTGSPAKTYFSGIETQRMDLEEYAV